MAHYAVHPGLRAFLASHLELDPQAFLWPVVADVTVGCNLACTMCFNSERVTRRFADDAVFRALEANVLPHTNDLAFGCRHEPMLHPQFPSALASLRQTIDDRRLAARLCVLTSGTLLSPETSALLLDARPHTVLLSIDTTNPQAYAAVRRPAHWEELRANLDHFLPQARERGVSVTVNMVLLRTTLPHVSESIQTFAELGLREVHLSQAAGVPGLGTAELLVRHGADALAIETEMAKASAAAKACGVSLWQPDDAPPVLPGEMRVVRNGATPWDEAELAREPGSVCVAPWSKLRVDHEGYVFPCEFAMNPKSAWGNIVTTPFADIVNGSRARETREKLLAGIAPMSACQRCPFGPGSRQPGADA